MPPRPCANHRAVLIPAGQRCPLCRQASQRRQDATRGPRLYDTGHWKRLSRAVLERDGYVCQLRLHCCTGRATTADHIVPLSRGGESTMANARAACRECNSSKRDR